MTLAADGPDGIDRPSPAAASDQRPRARRWLAGAGLAVAAWGAFALWKAFDIRQPTAYRPMGPRVFPVIISVALIVLGVLFVIETLRGADADVERHVAEELRSADHRQAGVIVVALVAYTWLFERAGYLVATTLFLPTVARLLGSRRLLRDAVMAVLLSLAAFYVFTRLLSIDLPEGVTENVLP